MPLHRNKLSARTVTTVSTPGRHSDGGNLYLNVSATGAKSWVFLYWFGGRQREMGLGSALDVSLAAARELAAAARDRLRSDQDPLLLKTEDRAVSFGEVADGYIDAMRPKWSNAKHAWQWSHTLTVYAANLRPMPVDSVDTGVVLSVLQPIWGKIPETASRLRGRIEAVLDSAKAKGLRSGENPARWRGHLDQVLPKRQKLTRGHHAALPIDDLPAFVAKLRARPGLSARVLEFTILTAARTGEAIGARWDEIDFERAVWTVPASRMKAKVEHRVPLSAAALAIVRVRQELRTSDYVFPGSRDGKPLSNMSMDKVLRLEKLDVTVHGFRSTFRDWAGERTDFRMSSAKWCSHTRSATASRRPTGVVSCWRSGVRSWRRGLRFAAVKRITSWLVRRSGWWRAHDRLGSGTVVLALFRRGDGAMERRATARSHRAR